VVFEPPLAVAGQSPAEVTTAIAQRLDRAIRAYPFEWVAYRPFLSKVSFPTTGVLPVLAGAFADPTGEVQERYRARLAGTAGVHVVTASLDGLSLVQILDRLQRGGHEVLVLVHAGWGDQLSELPLLLVWFFRLDPDWVAYDPEPAYQVVGGEGERTTFALSLIKTAALAALVARGVERLDMPAVRVAQRAKLRTYHVPSVAALTTELDRLESLGVELPQLLT
jgi:hypothetical protein